MKIKKSFISKNILHVVWGYFFGYMEGALL